MFRILIVDDEPAIVKGMVKMFMDNDWLELDIYKAYSAFDAIEIMKNTKIDIVLSDIRMPGMSGLEMLDQIVFFWPNCKVIFLTGHIEFEYLYEAIHKARVNYLLKTESDEVILKAVADVIKIIKQENEQIDFITGAKKYLEDMMPLVRKELFEAILYGEFSESQTLGKRFNELGIKMDNNLNVFTVVGRIDCLNDNMSYAEKNSLYYAVQDIFNNSLYSYIIAESIVIENSKIVWFLQPDMSKNRFKIIDAEVDWKGIAVFIKASLESIQSIYKDMLGIEVSFALPHGPGQWCDVYKEFEILKNLTSKRIFIGQHMIIDLGVPNDFFSNESDKLIIDTIGFNKKLKNLEKCLENGQEKEVKDICLEVMDDIKNSIKSNYLENFQKYYSFLLVFISYINKYGLLEQLNKDTDFERLMIMEIPNDWEKTEDFLIGLGKYLCVFGKEQYEKQDSLVIRHLHKYISENYGGDLSLRKLAEIVYFNPSYLSRFYKQVTGRNISDHINEVKLETAKIMLEDTNFKINEVAIKLGFESPSYFTSFIKRMTGSTPQQLRDVILQKEFI